MKKYSKKSNVLHNIDSKDIWKKFEAKKEWQEYLKESRKDDRRKSINNYLREWRFKNKK